MKIFIFTILSLWLYAQTAYAQAKLARAVFAIQNSNYNCAGLLNTIKKTKDFKYAWLYNTFDNSQIGSNLSCVREINQLPQTTFMEVHLINEVCQRNKNCGDYEFLYGISVNEYKNKLIDIDQAFLKKLDLYLSYSAKLILPTLNENIKCYISPGLESNLNQNAALELIKHTRKYYGDRCEIVWNPVNNNPEKQLISGTVYEQHGFNQNLTSPCIANLDGADINFKDRASYIQGEKISEENISDYLERYSHCEAALIWIAEDNCIEKQRLDPRKRTNCTNEERQLKILSLVNGAGQ